MYKYKSHFRSNFPCVKRKTSVPGNDQDKCIFQIFISVLRDNDNIYCSVKILFDKDMSGHLRIIFLVVTFEYLLCIIA